MKINWPKCNFIKIYWRIDRFYPKNSVDKAPYYLPRNNFSKTYLPSNILIRYDNKNDHHNLIVLFFYIFGRSKHNETIKYHN
jgi:hypothetical protein